MRITKKKKNRYIIIKDKGISDLDLELKYEKNYLELQYEKKILVKSIFVKIKLTLYENEVLKNTQMKDKTLLLNFILKNHLIL